MPRAISRAALALALAAGAAAARKDDCVDATPFNDWNNKTRDCAWVASRRNARCALYADSCPATCDACGRKHRPDGPALPPPLSERPARLAASDCPKVYVYDIPELWDFDAPWSRLHEVPAAAIFGEPCGDGVPDEFDTQQWSVAMLVLWRLATSERCGAVADPNEADLFLVPTWPAAKGLAAWDRACASDANGAVKHLKFLNERTAHRHFFVVGKGHAVPKGVCFRWWARPRGLLRRATRFAYSDQYGSGGPMSSYGPAFLDDPAEAARLQGDRVLDDGGHVPHLYSIPYPANVHAIRGLATPAAWNRSAGARPAVASYLASPRPGPYAVIREPLSRACEAAGNGACARADPHGIKSKHFCGLRGTTMAAFFCLQPGGDSPYRKGFFDAVVSGCVPVVFSQQLYRVAPWHRGIEALPGVPRAHHAIVFDGRKVLDGEVDVFSELAKLPAERVAALRRAARRAAPFQQYAVDDDFRMDAFEIILRAALAVAERREAATAPAVA